MSWTLRSDQLVDLARGAALLGTGGGGDPLIGRLMVGQELGVHRELTIWDPDDVPARALVIPTAQMGAPTVVVEKIPRGTEPIAALRKLERHLGRRADATMPIECGGINSMIPLMVAARTGLPVVDADGMGRAFPELQMETFGVYGISGSPLAVAGENGESAIIDAGADNRRMEWLARGLTIRLGGVAHIAEYPMTGEQVRASAVPRTISLALALGTAISQARTAHSDPIAAIARALAPTLYSHLRVLIHGKVIDVERRTVDGFARGRALIKSTSGASSMEIIFQNENLAAIVDDEVRCTVPDLICILAAETAEPITTEHLRYGHRVQVVGISTPDLMRTPKALATFGPPAFGLDHDFVPIEERITPTPLSD